MKRGFLLLVVALYGHLNAQIDVREVVKYSDSIMIQGVLQSKIPGAVLGIVSSDSLWLLKGYGYSNIDKNIRVNPDKTLFQLGSVGKLLTSVALLQQIEIGNISLDDDVNSYLDNWKIINPYNKPVTPFHLLTHTGGFNDRYINYMAKNNSELESLGQHLPKNMPAVFKEPGIEINYSNYGYALAGHLIEQVSGNDFEDQIQTAIFDPLRMSGATYYLPDDYLDNDLYANGYKTRETFLNTKMFPRHAKPAGSVVATGKDMIVFAQALLARDSVLLTNEGYDLLLNQQFSNHPKLTGYSMGMEVQKYDEYKAFAKGGQVTGFLSGLILFPEQDLAIFLSTNTQTDNHFEDFFKGFRSKFFPPQKPDTISLDFDTKEYTGVYANERTNHETIEELFALFSGQFRINESETGNLRAYHNGEWHEYQYLGDDIFQDLSDADNYIVFSRSKGKVSSMYRSVNTGGVLIPASYRKLSWVERPRFINDEYPYFLVVMITYLLLPLLWLIRFFIRKKKPEFLQKSKVPLYYHAVAFIFLGLFIWNIAGFFIPLFRLGENMALGFPDSLTKMRYVHWLMAACSVALVLLSARLWIKSKSTIWFRVYFTVFSLITLSYILMMYRWHFLNVSL